MLNQEKIILKEDAIKILKPIFKKFNCMDINHCISKEEILEEVEDKNKKQYFKILKKFNIIKSKNGRYYYQEANEENTKTSKKSIIILAIIAIIIIAIIAILVNANSNKNKKVISDDDITFSISDTWTQIEDYPQGYYFYKFISNEASAALIAESMEQTNSENATDNEYLSVDYEDYPASINVIYNQTDDELFDSIDDMSAKIQEYIEQQIQPDEYNIETSKTSQGYDILKIRLEFYEDPPEIDYLYYIFDDGRTASISANTYNSIDERQMKLALDDLANSFEWN